MDILKEIMTKCGRLGFDLRYIHMRAHQDDLLAYPLLSRLAQLNCPMGIEEKQVVLGLNSDGLPPQEICPLEAIAVFVGQEKMTSDTLESIQYRAHREVAKQTFHSLNTMNPEESKEVTWR
jgi:hypothetical protein